MPSPHGPWVTTAKKEQMLLNVISRQLLVYNKCHFTCLMEFQIYEHARGKRYCAELNRQVTLMGSLPWTLGDTRVSLDLLRSATRHLTQVL